MTLRCTRREDNSAGFPLNWPKVNFTTAQAAIQAHNGAAPETRGATKPTVRREAGPRVISYVTPTEVVLEIQ